MNAPSTMPVNTKKVTDRRDLHFTSAAQVLADASKLIDAEAGGKLVPLGNWTLGQAFGHITAFINYAYDGYPSGMSSPPWIIRIILPLFKKRFLAKLPVGMKMPKVPGGTYGIELISSAEGFEKLRAAFIRLDRQPLNKPNPVFGKFTPDDWKQLHLRHTELHLSFYQIKP